MDYQEIGLTITKLRQSQKLSQQALAAQVGISRATLNALEQGRAGDVGLRKVIKILACLNHEFALRERRALPSFEELRADD